MIGIVDTAAGNLTSVRAALDRLGLAHATLAAPELGGVERLLIPGQGRFGAVMAHLDATGWAPALRAWLAADRPLVGICVGLQVLFEASAEDPGVAGLGVLAGAAAPVGGPKRPMVGWADVAWSEPPGGGPDGAPGSPLDASLDGPAYFVNSFAVPRSEAAIAVADYGGPFVAAARRGRAVGVQFHPEKSGPWGQEVLRRCLSL